jgi:hypothetical protein
MSLNDFLYWLAWSGGAAIAAAFVLERIVWFQKQSSGTRSLLVMACSLAIALASFAVLRYVPGDVLKELAIWFQLVYGIVATWIASQVAHKADPAVSSSEGGGLPY